MRLRSLSGRKDSSSRSPIRKVTCEVILLDPTQANFITEINSNSNGEVLFTEVCEKLGGILEKDYLGLRYIDKHGQKQWLEMNKSISHQIKDSKNPRPKYMFSLRFKHYPKIPYQELKQDLSRYLLYLQLRRDLYRGRLVGKSQDQHRLAALVMKSETGEFNMSELEREVKLSDLKILPHITKKSELKILSIFKELKNLEIREAEQQFIEEACCMETYGVEPIAVKDQKGNDLFVGVTNDGISTFQGTNKTHTFLWCKIPKISYSHKLFMFEVVMEQKKHVLGFKCESSHAACALWKWALDKKYFFTLERAVDAKRSRSGGSLFRRKKTYTFCGRSQRELTQSCQNLQIIPQPQVSRAQSMMTLMRTISNRTDNHTQKQGPTSIDGFSTLPSRSKTINSLFNDENDGLNYGALKSSVIPEQRNPAMGVVMDFMNALKETPILRHRLSGNKNDFTNNEFDGNGDQMSSITMDTNLEDHLTESDKDAAESIASELVELATRQRAITVSTESSPKRNSIYGNNKNPIKSNSSTSNCLYLVVSMAMVFLLGSCTIIYLHSQNITKSIDTSSNIDNSPLSWFQKLFS